jgi:hypothetical protein
MHIHHPEIASEFDEATPKGSKLPEHVRKRKKKRKGLGGTDINHPGERP